MIFLRAFFALTNIANRNKKKKYTLFGMDLYLKVFFIMTIKDELCVCIIFGILSACPSPRHYLSSHKVV